MIWRGLKTWLFSKDAEQAHRLVVRLLLILDRFAPFILRFMSSSGARVKANPVEVCGLSFLNPVGLAAGFDKDAELVRLLPKLGFGFVEVGTVTPRPQPGNEKPRLFREVETKSIFNRMGFNSEGAEVVAERLSRSRPHLPEGFRVGINIGKNKDTPLESAAEDFEKAIGPFRDLADYVVINVSSPNTPGLRSLQTTEALKPIIDRVRNRLVEWRVVPPLFLKLAPELASESEKEVFQAILKQTPEWGVQGFVLTNTLAGSHQSMPGGWSGNRVKSASKMALIRARSLTRLPIISVGGIDSAEEGADRLRNGASLVQVYSGWIFSGPKLPSQISSVAN